MAVSLGELVEALDALLQPGGFRDYCPNGLQVEGSDEVTRVISGVTASQALIEAAAAEGADAILVHHGYFWRGEDPAIRGMKKRRIGNLLAHDISLLAYHLPLDAHGELGNNAQLGRRLGFSLESTLDSEYPGALGVWGYLEEHCTGEELAERITGALDRRPLHIAGTDRSVRSIGWCTGAAEDLIELAHARGLDAYLTGEVSERTVHFARENGMHFFAAGHHATERYGVQAVGQYLSDTFGVEHRYIDIDNPV